MSFEEDVHRWTTKVIDQEADFIKVVSNDLFKVIVDLTPAATGRTKGSWRARRNRPARGKVKRKDKTGRATIASAKRVIAKVKEGDSVYITNNWFVASIINTNPHGRMPERMVDKTFSRAPAIGERAIRKVRRGEI